MQQIKKKKNAWQFSKKPHAAYDASDQSTKTAKAWTTAGWPKKIIINKCTSLSSHFRRKANWDALESVRGRYSPFRGGFSAQNDKSHPLIIYISQTWKGSRAGSVRFHREESLAKRRVTISMYSPERGSTCLEKIFEKPWD